MADEPKSEQIMYIDRAEMGLICPNCNNNHTGFEGFEHHELLECPVCGTIFKFRVVVECEMRCTPKTNTGDDYTQ